jgi:predicted secreted protein
MSIKVIVGLYFVIWWTVLFATLPFGVKSQHEDGEIVPGTDPGAPVNPMMLKKALWTTAITTTAVALIYAMVTYKLVVIK